MEGRQVVAVLSVADRKRLLGVEDYSGSPGNWLPRSATPSPTHNPTPTPSGLKGKLSKLRFTKKSRMATKPPLAPKPEFLPNGSPRRKVPPPIKPVPYAQHKQSRDTGVKPSPAPRAILPDVLPKPPRGSLDKGRPIPPARPAKPLSPTPPKVPDVINRRPRLGTPMSPPEPSPELISASVPIPVPVVQNGIHSHTARSPGNQKTVSPSHVSRSPLRTEPAAAKGELYAEVQDTATQEPEPEQEEYTVVRDVPRRTPPRFSPERTVFPDTEYSVTSHLAETRKLQGKNVAVPPPTLPDEYSCLDRPERRLSPVLLEPDSIGYSVLDIPDTPTAGPRSIPTLQESYGHLEFPNRGTTEAAEPQADVERYEILPSDSHLKTPSAAKPPFSPRTKARRATQKSKLGNPLQVSRDRSVLPAYTGDGGDSPPMPCSSPRPVPPRKPKRQRPGQQSGTETGTEPVDQEPPPPLPPPPSPETLEEVGYETWRTFSPPPDSDKTHAVREEESSTTKAAREQQSLPVTPPTTTPPTATPLTMTPFLVSPKCEVDIDQLVAAAEKTIGSSPIHSTTSARLRDHMYDEIVEVSHPKALERHSDGRTDTSAAAQVLGHENQASLDPEYEDPDAVAAKGNSSCHSRFVFPVPEGNSDLGPLPVVMRSEGVGAEKQPSKIIIEPASSPSTDFLGYTEIDIVQKPQVEPAPKPKPRTKPKPRPKPKDSTPNPKDISPNPKDISPNPKDISPIPKDSSPIPKDSSPNPKDISPDPKDNQEVKTPEDPAAGAGVEDIYVSSVLIHTRKEQAKKNKEAGKDQKTAQKPLGPPRRRPPPPPINALQSKLAVALSSNLKLSRSHSNEVPTDAGHDEVRTASKPTGSPKHKDKSIFSRAKSRSLKSKAVSPSPVEEKTSFEADASAIASSPKRLPNPSHSPSIGKRFKGLVRRQSKKTKNKDDTEKFTEPVPPSAKAMTLPSRSPIKHGCVDCVDEFGIYSVVQDPAAGKKSLEAEDDILMDADSYAVVDTEDIARRAKKVKKKPFNLRKSSSVEHLYESAELDQLAPSGAEGGAKSACSSPQPRRRKPPVGPPLPYRSPMGHIATLPRRRPPGAGAGTGAGAEVANVDLTQLYATVTKQPKGKKKKNKNASASAESEPPVGKMPVEAHATPEAPLDGSDRRSLSPETAQPGLLSSEIDHTVADGGQEYAVIQTKKRRSSGDGLAAEVLAAVGLGWSEEEPVRSKGEELSPQGGPPTRPPKPPRSNKTTPPTPPGEIIPLSSEMQPGSSSMSGDQQVPGIRRLSTGGPPSFPPPPPPPSQEPDSPPGTGVNLRGRGSPLVSASRPVPAARHPPPIEREDGTEFPMDHTYEIPTLEKQRYLQESQTNNPGANFVAKAEEAGEPLQTKPEVPMVQIAEALKDRTPKQRNPHMYEMVEEETKAARDKHQLAEFSRTEPEVPMVQIAEALKDRTPKQRNPHMYEMVEEETKAARDKHQLAEFSQTEPEVDVMTVKRTPAGRSLDSYETVEEPLKGRKHQHVYDIVTEFADKGARPKKRRSRLPPRSKPPPAPPSTNGRFTLDDSGQTGSPQLSNRKSLTPPDSEPSPATEPLLRKRIHVEIAGSSAGVPFMMADGRPQFLFPKSHSQSFIEVGQHDAMEGTPSPSQSSSTLSGFDDETDSTEWETSSGEEDEGPSQPPRPKTYYIAQEVLTTERTFVKGLTLLHKDFRQTVQSANRAHEKPVIADEVLRQILGNVGSLLTLNSGLLNELEERMAHWEEDPRIGDILLSRAPYMKLYTDYISRFDKALKMLEEVMKKNSVFAAVVREFEAQPKCANLPLASYMLETVQRVPRYKMLLADYIKHLPDGSVDRAPSEGALKIISETATHVNETIRQMDNFRKVMEVCKKLIGDTGDTLITPYRKLLKEGELLKYSRKEKQPRMFFLFSDILIYASSVAPANTTFKALKRIPLDGMRVESLDDPEMRHGFQIISTCKSFRLEAMSESERELWLTAFEQAIKEHKEQVESRERARKNFAPDEDENETSTVGHLAPPWLPDSTVSMCQLCSVPFTVTKRRHHCRGCGMIFCADCSAYLAPLKYKGSKLGRVCQTCYDRICNVPAVEDSDGDRTPVKGRHKATQRSQKLVNLPSVLREVKARDQNAQISGYLLSHTSKTKRWKKKWFMVYNLVMYEFERHEDVTAKRSITLPSYHVISPVPRHDDPLVFCLRHPGCGKSYFKADSGEQLQRWIEVLQRAVKGEIDDEPVIVPPEQKLDPLPPDQNPDPEPDQEPNQKPDQEPDQKSDEVPSQKSDDSET